MSVLRTIQFQWISVLSEICILRANFKHCLFRLVLRNVSLNPPVEPNQKQYLNSFIVSIQEIKPPNSPDDRSPSRQSNRSQDIKPSPKVKRDQSEERKVTAPRPPMEDQRVQKRVQEGERTPQDDARMARMGKGFILFKVFCAEVKKEHKYRVKQI